MLGEDPEALVLHVCPEWGRYGKWHLLTVLRLQEKKEKYINQSVLHTPTSISLSKVGR